MSLKKKRTKVPPGGTKVERTPMQDTPGKGGQPDYDDRKSLFYTPRESFYGEELSMVNEKEARASVTKLAKEFKFLKSRDDKRMMIFMRKGIDNTAKRARMSTKRTTKPGQKGRITSAEKKQMGKVAKIYEDALKGPRFKIPAKKKSKKKK